MRNFILSVENADDNSIKEFTKIIKSISKLNPSFKITIKEEKNIPCIDEAIKEYKMGEVLSFKNYDEAMRYLESDD